MGGTVSVRKTIFWLHLIAGVVAGVVILVMSVTGTLLMYQKQITAWADGAKVEAPANAERIPATALLAKVQESESGKPTAMTVYSDPNKAVAISYGREKTVFVNPYTGAVIGEGSKKARAFFQSMIEWHRWLGMSGENRPLGKAITGACNLAFLFLVLSGIYLWWPRNWSWRSLKAVTVFDGSLRGKARDWNWHNVIGFWSAIPLAVLVFTAVFFSYPWATDLLYRATGSEAPKKGGGGGGSRQEKGNKKEEIIFAGTDQAWAAAERQAPGWKSINLRLTDSAEAPLVFAIDRGNGARPDLRGTLTVEAASGRVEKWETYSDEETARKIRLWVRWLHTGEAGGFLGQTLAGVASAGGAVLVWTGMALAIRRLMKTRARGKVEIEEREAVSVS